LALSFEALGDIARARSDNEDARSDYENARAILQALVDSDPKNGGWASILSGVRKKTNAIETSIGSRQPSGKSE
jgi:hypothetical protein